LYRKKAVTWPFNFYTIIWALSGAKAVVIKLSFRAMLFCMTPKHKTGELADWDSFRAMLFSALILQKGSRRFLCDHKKYGGLKIFG